MKACDDKRESLAARIQETLAGAEHQQVLVSRGLLEEICDVLEWQRYADLEHEHLGCDVAKTGIYAPSHAPRNLAPCGCASLTDCVGAPVGCGKAFFAPSTTACKPRGSYVPLNEEEIERVRSVYKRHFSDGERLDTVCDMAVNSLLFSKEIDRLRTTASATRQSILEEAARACEKLAERRFEEHGFREPDTNATYYGGHAAEEYDTRDEEDADCAAAIRALNNRPDGTVKP